MKIQDELSFYTTNRTRNDITFVETKRGVRSCFKTEIKTEF